MVIKKKLLLAVLGTSFVVAAVAQNPSGPDPVVERPAWPSHQEYTTAPTAPTPVIAPSEPSAADTTEIDGAYVLQVGAFRERALAERAAGEIRQEGVRILTTRRGEQDWYVLVLGVYESHVDAREAGEAYLATHPEGSIWVRAATGLRNSRANGDSAGQQ